MKFSFKKIIFNIFFNLTIFLILIIAIQNSSDKRKVNLIISNTIDLPISFIIGMGFISGSIAGNFLFLDFDTKKN